MAKIEKNEILKAQQVWGNQIVEIGKAFLSEEDYKKVAQNLVAELYGFSEGIVLFKPTKVSKHQFRLNFEGALSYFIGDDTHFSEDKGFALHSWKRVRFENAAFLISETQAISMGNYFFTDYKGNETKVEYTLGYFRSTNGKIKINLHHSSLPFEMGKTVK